MKTLQFLAIFLFLSSCTSKKTLTETDITSEESILLDEIVVETSTETRPYRASKERTHDLLHTKLEVSFDWKNRHVLGTAELELKPYFYSSDVLEIDAKSMDIHRVALVSGSEKADLDFDYDGLIIHIKLDKVYKRNETYKLFIDYTAKPEEVEQKGSSAIGLANGLYFINPDSTEVNKPTQIWTQGETESSSCWFPTIDSPNERMTQEIAITVSEKYKTLSNGELMFQNYNGDGTRTDYWNQSIPHAPYLVMLAVGDYKIIKDSWKNGSNELLVDYYMEEEYAPYAKDIFGNTPEMLSFYSEVLGYPYPWDKYSQVIVRDFVSGAMENTTAVIHGDFLNATSKELKDSDNEDIIAHELFHHWFGDLVTCESWSNLPLNESFATYGEYLWIEHKYGRDAADLHGYESMLGYLRESQSKQENLIRFYYDDKEDMFDGHSYNKGGRILHMLRYFLGDEAFFEGLKLYLKENEFSAVEIHQLRLAMEEVSGKDLNWFFNQWFLGKGHPNLEITYEVKTDSVVVNVSQIQGSLFRLPLQVDVVTSNGADRTRIDVRKRTNRFSLPYNGTLSYVNVDADQILLGTKLDDKPESWWAAQLTNSELFLDKKDALDQCLTLTDLASLTAVYKALDDPFWKIQEQALDGVINLKPQFRGLENKLVQLVNTSTKTQVKSKALEALCEEFNPQNHLDLINSAYNGDSYLVTSSALVSYSFLDPVLALEKCKTLEEENNYYISSSIGYIYGEYGTPEEQDYFEDKLKTASAGEAYDLLTYYSSFLVRQDLEVMKTGMNTFTEQAKNGSQWFVKLGAFYGIKSIIDAHNESDNPELVQFTKELTTTAKSILENQTDLQLKQYAPQF